MISSHLLPKEEKREKQIRLNTKKSGKKWTKLSLPFITVINSGKLQAFQRDLLKKFGTFQFSTFSQYSYSISCRPVGYNYAISVDATAEMYRCVQANFNLNISRTST